jgi:ubiquinol-cytochrome c reductase subunit 6
MVSMVIMDGLGYISFGEMSDIRGTIRGMLEKGQDPKEYLIEVCRPQCTSLQQKLQRCETALKNMTHADPELSCMYPLRDWVTCVDGCVLFPLARFNPKSMQSLSATSMASTHDPSTI